MTDIVIPYLHSEVVWNELIFTVRSIEKNFEAPFRIWLFGDNNPALKLNHVPVERIKNRTYAKTFDSIKKMYAIINHPDISEDFIYWYDDIVLLQKIDLSFFDNNYYIQNLSKTIRNPLNNYSRVIWYTHDMIKKQKDPYYNYETHLPRLFNKTKMKVMLDEYAKPNEPLIIASLYFNLYSTTKPIALFKDDKIKAGFYGADDFYSFGNKVILNSVLRNKMFLSYNNKGLTKSLRTYIISQFKTKSKFE